LGKVVVLGSLNMDISIEASRVPQQGETVDGSNLCINPGGKGANQAVAAARMGAATTMVGAVGADAFGAELVGAVAQAGVDCSPVQALGSDVSGVALVIRHEGNNRIVVGHGANYAVTPDAAERALRSLLAPNDVFLTQFECPPDTVERAVNVAHELGAYVMVNPSPVRRLSAAFCQKVDLLCLNELECAYLLDVSVAEPGTQSPQPQQSPQAALTALGEKGVRSVVLTLGECGSQILHDGSYISQPAYAVDAKDTTCAGDTFVGTLAACMAQEVDMRRALKMASAASALACTQVGAQRSIPSLEQVTKALEERW
jgi:ribokinase